MTDRQSIRTFLNKVKDDYIDASYSKDLVASGKTVRSLKVVYTELRGNDLTWTREGRGPGGMPSIQTIAAWMRVRGMVGSPWAIAKHIAENGTRIYNKRSLGLDIDKIVKLNLKAFTKSVSKEVAQQVVQAIREFNK